MATAQQIKDELREWIQYNTVSIYIFRGYNINLIHAKLLKITVKLVTYCLFVIC